LIIPPPPPSAVDQKAIYGLWLQSGAIIVTVVVAIITIIHSARVAKRRATLDLIMFFQSNKELMDTRKAYIELRDKGHLAQWAAPEKAGSDEQAIINNVLNRYELVAIGIHERTINERIWKRWLRTGTVQDWIAAKPYIAQLRQNKFSALYCEYERLAKRWASRDEAPHI
jgi:hypothetical protein